MCALNVSMWRTSPCCDVHKSAFQTSQVWFSIRKRDIIIRKLCDMPLLMSCRVGLKSVAKLPFIVICSDPSSTTLAFDKCCINNCMYPLWIGLQCNATLVHMQPILRCRGLECIGYQPPFSSISYISLTDADVYIHFTFSFTTCLAIDAHLQVPTAALHYVTISCDL